jgi:hypothetical protein
LRDLVWVAEVEAEPSPRNKTHLARPSCSTQFAETSQ